MVRKKNKHIVLIILGIIVLLAVLNWFGLFNFGKTYSLIDMNDWQEYGSPIEGYTCSSSATKCEVNGILECNQGVVGTVGFRTNVLSGSYASTGSDGNNPWIAYSVNNVLSSFNYSSTDILDTNNFGTTPDLQINGGDLFFRNGIVYVTKHEIVNNGIPSVNHRCANTACNCVGACGYAPSAQYLPSCGSLLDCGVVGYSDGEKFYKFVLGNGAITITSPTEPYTSQNCGGTDPCQEKRILGGPKQYTCDGIFQIKDTSGNVFYSTSLADSKDNPWNKSINDKSIPRLLSPGEKAYFASAGGGGIPHLLYKDKIELEDCSSGNKNLCLLPDTFGNSNGFYNCENGIINRNNITYCDNVNGFYCQEGACQVPFQTKEIAITDSAGNIKTGFTKDENIKVRFRLIGKAGTPIYNVHNGLVKLEFFKVGEQIAKSNIVVDYDFSSGTTLSPSIDNPASDGDLGLYYLVVSAIYDPSKSPIKIGLENINQPTYQISIGSSVSCSIQLQTSITDIMTSKLLTNVPILVKLNPTVGGVGSAVLTKTVKVYMNKGTAQEQSVILDVPSSEGSSGGAYTYVYNFLTDKPGDIYAKADISDSGVPASCTSTAKVEDMKITTSQYNVGGSCLPSGPHTFFFETLDSLNRQVAVTSNLCVKKPGSGTVCDSISNLVEAVPGGKIGQNQFTYDLVKNVGETAQYTFQLTTHSTDFNRDYNVPDINIEVKDNCVPVECRTTKECQVSKGDTYMCVNGSCQNNSPNWILYVGIGIGVLILLVAGYFIIRSVRKPKSEIYTGLEGL